MPTPRELRYLTGKVTKLKLVRAQNRARSEIRIRISKRDLDDLDSLCKQWRVSRSMVFRAMLKKTLTQLAEMSAKEENELLAAVNALTAK